MTDFLCPCVSMSIRLPVCQHVCLSVYIMPVYISVCQSVISASRCICLDVLNTVVSRCALIHIILSILCLPVLLSVHLYTCVLQPVCPTTPIACMERVASYTCMLTVYLIGTFFEDTSDNELPES